MVALKKLCFFTHIRLFIMFLSAIFFTFIFPFETQQCCAWIVLGTSNMFCFTLLRLLNVCKWILILFYFLVIDTCCVKSWNVAHRIFARKEDGFTTFIMFISHVVCLGLYCFVFCRCFLVLYLFISLLLFGFWTFFAIIYLYRIHFMCCWVCIVLLFIVVFLFSTCSFPFLLFGFPNFLIL
jgi:hypothetical protein